MAFFIGIDEIFERHEPGPGHPESPARGEAVRAALAPFLEREGVERIALREATREELERVHEGGYIDLVEREVGEGRLDLSTGDTAISERSYEVALLASGMACAAVDLVMGGDAERAFCGLRPPGHHASQARGMGFCLFNHVAVAARHAQAAHGAERVAIIDWDVHHGNGTQDIFYEDGSVFFFSSHQSPWYPGTGAAAERGEGEGRGSTLNLPLAARSGMVELAVGFDGALLPALEKFRPDLVLISAGFDSREGDPLGQLRLKDEDFVALTERLGELAARHCGGRIVSLLEGGYLIEGLSKAVAAHVGALIGG